MTYLKNEKLKETLEDEVLIEKIRKLNEGDELIKNEIIEHNLKLVLFLVRKFSNTEYDKDDLISIGIIGLIKAINKFDINKNFKFATFASRCIENEILMFLRTAKKYNKYTLVSLTAHSTEDTLETELEGIDALEENDSNLILEDTLEAPDSDFTLKYEKEEIYKELRKFIEELSEKEKYIIMLHFGFIDGNILTQKQIAKKLGISQSYVSRIIKRILRKIEFKLKIIGIVRGAKGGITIDTNPPKTKVLSLHNLR